MLYYILQFLPVILPTLCAYAALQQPAYLLALAIFLLLPAACLFVTGDVSHGRVDAAAHKRYDRAGQHVSAAGLGQHEPQQEGHLERVKERQPVQDDAIHQRVEQAQSTEGHPVEFPVHLIRRRGLSRWQRLQRAQTGYGRVGEAHQVSNDSGADAAEEEDDKKQLEAGQDVFDCLRERSQSTRPCAMLHAARFVCEARQSSIAHHSSPLLQLLS